VGFAADSAGTAGVCGTEGGFACSNGLVCSTTRDAGLGTSLGTLGTEVGAGGTARGGGLAGIISVGAGERSVAWSTEGVSFVSTRGGPDQKSTRK